MELEKLVSLAQQEKDGVLGACMTGGGFGGCTVTLLRSHALASIKQRIEVPTGVEPPNKGHYGANDFVPCRDTVSVSEVKYKVPHGG